MIPLAISIAISGEHARLTHLETSNPFINATLGTAADQRIVPIEIVHGVHFHFPSRKKLSCCFFLLTWLFGRIDDAGPSSAPPCRSHTLVARLTNAATDTPAVGLLSRNRRDRISGGGVAVRP